MEERAGGDRLNPGLMSFKEGDARSYRGDDHRHSPARRLLSCQPPKSPAKSAFGAVHLGITGRDQVEESVADWKDKVDFTLPLGFRPMQCRRRGPPGLDRRRHHGRPRRRRRWLSPAPRPTAHGRYQIHQPHPRLLRWPRHCRLPDRRKPGRHRRCAGDRSGRPHRRHHHDWRNVARQRPENAWKTASSWKSQAYLVISLRRGVGRRHPITVLETLLVRIGIIGTTVRNQLRRHQRHMSSIPLVMSVLYRSPRIPSPNTMRASMPPSA